MFTELGKLTEDLPDLGKMNKKGPFKKIEDFFGAIEDAEEGDLITLAANDKPYVVNKVPTFRGKRGTVENPIIVRAEEPGKVTLEGSAGYGFVDCTYFTWYGFHHAHKSAKEGNISFKGGNNNRFARCEINLDDGNNREKRHWLNISKSEAMKVDHCYFHHKKSAGQFCNVKFNDHIKPGKGPILEYNYFQHQDYGEFVKEYGDIGGEAIQMGDSVYARWYYRAIVRYNFFEQCNGDNEIITNKSSGNLYYNNTFVDSKGSLTLRHGESTAVLGNYFRDCGLRVAGADNLIANNHFTENSKGSLMLPITIHNGNIENPVGPYPEGKPKRNYERVVNNEIILNTLANGDGEAKQIVLWGGNRTLMPYNNRFRGNIITGKNGTLFEFKGAKATFEEKIKGEKKTLSNDISDNIAWADGRKGDNWYGGLTENMAERIDPKLVRNEEDGIYRLSEDSRACSKFEGTPFEDKTDVDIYGMNRSGHTDAGCHQYTEEPGTPKRRITPKDVGVSAPTPWNDSPKWNPPSKGRGKK